MIRSDGVEQGLFWLVAFVDSGWQLPGLKTRGHAVMIAAQVGAAVEASTTGKLFTIKAGVEGAGE